jgi:hypothetical protein
MKLFQLKSALTTVAAVSILALTAINAQAESSIVTAASGALSTTAKLDFKITIPRVLYLRIGTGTNNAANTAVDLLDYQPAGASIGNGTAVSATTGGDVAAGAVTVRVFGNGGAVTLNSGTTGAMTNGVATQTIPWSEITATPAVVATPTAGYTAGSIAHPAFNLAALGGAGTATTLTTVNNVTKVESKWTFTYNNSNVPAAGVYGTSANAGRVTYTASMP